MTTTTALAPRPEEPKEAPAKPPARDHRRHLASWTQKDWYRAAAVAVAITALGAATDAIFAADILKLLVGSSSLAYLTAVGAVTVASACAFFAGHAIHHAVHKLWGWILLGVWAGIGIGLAVMRMIHSQIKVPDTEDVPAEEIDRILRNTLLADIGMGVLMLVIFLATGILLIHKAKDLADPDLRRMLQGVNTLSGAFAPPFLIACRSPTAGTRAQDLGPEEQVLITETISSSGRPMEEHLRSEMENLLGHSFANVHVHTDETAHR